MKDFVLMQPTAIAYIALFAVTALIYYVLPLKIRNAWLIIASLVFIGINDFRYAAVAFAAAVFTWGAGRLIRKASGSGRSFAAKVILTLHIAVILAMVLCLRYFAAKIGILTIPEAESAVAAAGEAASIAAKAASAMGIEAAAPVIAPAALIPVGIMIYSLKAISYTAGIFRKGSYYSEDSYQSEATGCEGFGACILYLLFFPVLTVGPIDTPEGFALKISEGNRFRYENLQEGFLLILWGFLLKLVLADNIADYVDMAFTEDPTVDVCGAFVLIASILLPIQIYATFYGLSAVASGYARILGFETPENFGTPFLSGSMNEFRKSWNSTLNGWMERNIYTPLTKGRSSKLYRALCLILMTLCIGAWYGKNSHYIAGALLLGIYEVIESATVCRHRKDAPERRHSDRGVSRVIMTVIRYAVCSLACVFFRSVRLLQTEAELMRIETDFRAPNLSNSALADLGFLPRYWVLVIAGIAVLLAADIFKKKGIVIHKWIRGKVYPVRLLVYLTAFVIIMIFGCWGFGYHEPHLLCDFLN